MNKAIQVIMMYGSLHAAVKLPSMKTRDGKRDALIGTKIIALTASTLFSVSLFPIYMYNDMNRLHIYMNNLNPKDYGYKTEFNDITDILFN